MTRIVLVAALAAVALASTAGATVADTWSPLRRPLHVPVLPAGARCPVSRVDPRVDWTRMHIFGGSGIGRGPAYPGLGLTRGFVWATRTQYGGPWFGEKVFWFVLPSYRGPVLIRGRRLDGPELVRFGAGRLPVRELHIEPGESVSWQGQPARSRGLPSGVRLKSPGCYGFQLDGTSFSRIVVVTADLPR